MKIFAIVFCSLILVSCASRDPKFEKEKVCSSQSLNYLKKQTKTKKYLFSEALNQELMQTQPTMQQCYESFRARSGQEEFNTCLVVGVDRKGKTEFFNFSSNDIQMDKEFIECAHKVTKSLQYGKHGKNYVIVQAYQFYYQ